jgi:hypothetical protein
LFDRFEESSAGFMAVEALGFESVVDLDLVGHATGCGLTLNLDLERRGGKSRCWKRI